MTRGKLYIGPEERTTLKVVLGEEIRKFESDGFMGFFEAMPLWWLEPGMVLGIRYAFETIKVLIDRIRYRVSSRDYYMEVQWHRV